MYKCLQPYPSSWKRKKIPRAIRADVISVFNHPCFLGRRNSIKPSLSVWELEGYTHFSTVLIAAELFHLDYFITKILIKSEHPLCLNKPSAAYTLFCGDRLTDMSRIQGRTKLSTPTLTFLKEVLFCFKYNVFLPHLVSLISIQVVELIFVIYNRLSQMLT